MQIIVWLKNHKNYHQIHTQIVVQVINIQIVLLIIEGIKKILKIGRDQDKKNQKRKIEGIHDQNKNIKNDKKKEVKINNKERKIKEKEIMKIKDHIKNK